MISQIVSMAFDPEASSQEIREIFSDRLARTLWLGIKQCHVVSRNFNRAIPAYAKLIADEMAKEGEVFCAEKLFKILSGYGKNPICRVIGEDGRTFAAELLPFIKGEKEMTFKVTN
ncbi:MAG: hypothetical protein ACD_9C00156G0001 [uncultured bacterium]|nr:MAG: hypothetical protein ACD_9C00156G0001 [uncultured bacterium]